jgi:hypothetical protein
MKRSVICAIAAVAVSVASLGPAYGQQTIPAGNSIITQWGFNNGNTNGVSVGTGSLTASSALGVAYQLPLFNANPNLGAANDNNISSQVNNGYLNVNGEFPTDASGEGVGFLTSTQNPVQPAYGYQDLTVTWDQEIGSRASEYWQVVYTTNGGTTWQPVPSTGTGSTATTLGAYTSATVSNSGLVTISAPTGINSTTETSNGASIWMYPLSYSFPVGGAWENDAGFGVVIEAIYNPYETDSSATDYGYVAADNGINSSDATNGFVRSAGSGGGDRYDQLTVSGVAVPEPTSLCLLAIGSIATLARRKRA